MSERGKSIAVVWLGTVEKICDASLILASLTFIWHGKTVSSFHWQSLCKWLSVKRCCSCVPCCDLHFIRCKNLKTLALSMPINKMTGQNPFSSTHHPVPQNKEGGHSVEQMGGKWSCAHHSWLHLPYWDSLPASLIKNNVFHSPPLWHVKFKLIRAANRDRIPIDWFWLEVHFLISN